MKRKKIIVFLLSCIATACLLFGCAQKEKGPQFLEGVITEVEVGTDVLISDLVEFDESENYAFTITDPSDKEKDYTNRELWIPEDVGEHTLTYTILDGKNAGEATHVIEVLAREIEWSFNNFSTYIYQMGTTLEFDKFFEEMNVLVQSDYDYTLSMASVLVDGERIDLTGKTSYTFASLSDHVFRFRVDTADGQYSVATVVVGVRYMEPGAEVYLQENNISEYNYLKIMKDRSVMLGASTYTGKAAKVGKTDVGYLSFDGEYGAGDYVQFDFTGSNLPQLCFFAKETTPDLVDGKDGLYLANGFGAGLGSERTRFTYYGPWKIKGAAFGGTDRLRVETQSPIGSDNLDENARYRYIAGVSKVEETTYKKGEETYTGNAATLRLLLINLDTGEIVCDKEVLLDTMAQYGLADEYFTGNIVAYGTLGVKTAWDKIYPVHENVSDIYTLAKTASLKENCANTVPVNTTLNVSDYIEVEAGVDYDFYYVDETGARTDIEESTFSFTQAGEYRLFYKINDGETIITSLKMTVTEMQTGVWEFLQTNGMRVYKTTIGSDSTAVTQAGTLTGKTSAVGSTDIPYLSFDGEYGAGDYVQFDFTGSNLPQLAFFVKETTPNLVDGKDGLYLANGFGEGMGTERTRMTYYGPWKIKGAVLGGSNRLKVETDSTIGADNLDANTRYRYIAGVSSATAGEVELRLLLIDLDNGTFVYDNAVTLDMTAYGLPSEYFTGNIVAYGNLSNELHWDKIYPVQENVTDVSELVTLASFKATAKLTVKTGASLNVSDYIAPATGEEYELYYTNANGDKTTVSGETFSFAQAGEYQLYYRPIDGETLISSLEIVAQDMTETAWSFLTGNNISGYGATFGESNGNVGVTLTAGTYRGNNSSATGETDVPYVAFNQSYGTENFLAVDFTGNNMPNISFFNDTSAGTALKNFTSRKGIFLTQGIAEKDGTMNGTIAQRYLLFAPNNFSGNVWGGGYQNLLTKDDTMTGLTYSETSKTDNANKEYRLIVGFHTPEADGQIEYSIILMEKNASGAEYEYSILHKSVAQSFSKDTYADFDFNGSIVIYGRPYMTTTLDKVHSVYYNNLKSTVLGWTGESIW